MPAIFKNPIKSEHNCGGISIPKYYGGDMSPYNYFCYLLTKLFWSINISKAKFVILMS